MSNNPFGGIGNQAAPNRRGQFFQYNEDKTPARYLVDITSIKHQSGAKGQFFILESKLIETDARKNDGSPIFGEGTMMVNMIKLGGQYADSQLGKIKGILLAAAFARADEKGVKRPPESLIDGDFVVKVCDSNVFEGTRLAIEATHTLTRDKKDFTIVLAFAPKDVGVDKDQWVKKSSGVEISQPAAAGVADAEAEADANDLFN